MVKLVNSVSRSFSRGVFVFVFFLEFLELWGTLINEELLFYILLIINKVILLSHTETKTLSVVLFLWSLFSFPSFLNTSFVKHKKKLFFFSFNRIPPGV